MSEVEDAGKVPELSWKPLSYEELCEALRNRKYLPTAIDAWMLKLVEEEKVRAWLDDEGEIRYQYKPEYLRHGGR